MLPVFVDFAYEGNSMIGNGFIFSVLVLLPNLLMLFFPPKVISVDSTTKAGLKYAAILERCGQVFCFSIPIFCTVDLSAVLQKMAFAAMLMVLLFYYAGWCRYLFQDREYRQLFWPMAGIPLPMALSPVIYFMTGSAVLNSWLLFGASLLLAAGHLPISYHTYNDLKRGHTPQD